MSHQGDVTAYMRVMGIGQAWASELSCEVEMPEMNRQLGECNATKEDTRVFRLLSPKSRQPMCTQKVSNGGLSLWRPRRNVK
jgi:hypothetical protein